jgi:hypothetical protein
MSFWDKVRCHCHTVNLAYPGFKATPQTLALIASRLEDIHPSSDDKLVLDLLSNSTFMGTDADGLPMTRIQGEDCTYHIPGSRTVAPASATKKSLLIAV